MTTETKTNHIPVELLRLVATAENPTVQTWIEDGHIQFRIWLRGKNEHGVIGGSILGNYHTLYAESDNGTTNIYCFFAHDYIVVKYAPSVHYQPRKEGEE